MEREGPRDACADGETRDAAVQGVLRDDRGGAAPGLHFHDLRGELVPGLRALAQRERLQGARTLKRTGVRCACHEQDRKWSNEKLPQHG